MNDACLWLLVVFKFSPKVNLNAMFGLYFSLNCGLNSKQLICEI